MSRMTMKEALQIVVTLATDKATDLDTPQAETIERRRRDRALNKVAGLYLKLYA